MLPLQVLSASVGLHGWAPPPTLGFDGEPSRAADVHRRVDHDAIVGGVDAVAAVELVGRAALAPVLPVEIELDVALELARAVEELVAASELRAARQGEVDACLERFLGAT